MRGTIGTRWPEVLQVILATLQTDADLALLTHGAIYRSGSREFAVPSLEVTVVANTEAELWEPVLLQFDVFATAASDGDEVRLERRILDLLTSRAPFTLSALLPGDPPGTLTVDLRGFFAGARDAATAEGIMGRQIDVRFEVLHTLYDANA